MRGAFDQEKARLQEALQKAEEDSQHLQKKLDTEARAHADSRDAYEQKLQKAKEAAAKDRTSAVENAVRDAERRLLNFGQEGDHADENANLF